MQTRKLGKRGPEISVVGFGAWEAGGDAYGPNTSDEDAVQAIRAGLDAGMTWIDTAEVYGDGHSEELVGRAVEGHREEVVIATKVAPAPYGTGFREDEVRRACEQSLQRLGTNRIDLYQLHWPDDEVGVSLGETWKAMAGLMDEGKVRCIGVSNFSRELIESCLAIRHVDSLQPQFSLLHLEERELIRWCGEQGIGVVAYGPLAFGLLTGAVTAETEFSPDDWRSRPQTEGPFADLGASLAIVDRLRPIAERVGCTLGQLALAWNVHQPGVTAA